MMAEAGIRFVFVGIETPNKESLKESKKRQNVVADLVSSVERFLEHGIAVTAGMIVGFDADGPDIFEQMYDFAMCLPVPVFSLGALVAPNATPLHERMKREGRLMDGMAGAETSGSPLETNIVPKRMTRQQLMDGIRWLCNRLYSPEAFEHRLNRFFRTYRDINPSTRMRFRWDARPMEWDWVRMIASVPWKHPDAARMFMRQATRVVTDWDKAFPYLSLFMFGYRQVRHMYDAGQIWEPHLDTQPTPAAPELVQLRT